MNKEREDKNIRSALAPSSVKIGSITIRPMSVESLSVLDLLGNPFAHKGGGDEPGIADLAEFIWAHGEDPDTVLEIALESSPVHKPRAREAALRFCRGLTQEDMAAVMANVAEQKERIEAASYDAKSTGKKKA